MTPPNLRRPILQHYSPPRCGHLAGAHERIPDGCAVWFVFWFLLPPHHTRIGKRIGHPGLNPNPGLPLTLDLLCERTTDTRWNFGHELKIFWFALDAAFTETEVIARIAEAKRSALGEHLSLQSSHRCFFLQPTVIVPHAHWEAYGRGSLPLHMLVSDSGNPHYVSDPLPQYLWDHRSTGQP